MSGGNIVKKLMAAQATISRVQEEINASEFTGQSQGGLVVATVSGVGVLKQLVIDPTVMTEDQDTVASLVKAAVNDAVSKKDVFSKEKLKSVKGALMPTGLKIPGLG